MGLFRYQGRNANQELVSGELESDSIVSVANQLVRDNVTPTHIEPIKRELSFFESLDRRLFSRPVKRIELINFCRQMHTLSKAGVPVVKALSRLATTADSTVLSGALHDISDALSAGQSLGAALKKYPNIFKPVFVSLIEAGESSGNLDRAFSQLAEYLELETKIARQLKSTIRYPTIVIAMAAIAVAVINFFVVPAFSGFYRQMSGQLPLPTKILIAISAFFQNHWLMLFISILAMSLGVYYLLKTKSGSYWWDKWKLRLPILGAIFDRIFLAQFARTFAMVLGSGVPLVKGIHLVGHAIDNRYIGDHVIKMGEAIERGEMLTKAAIASGLFSPLVIQMLSVGEESGSIDELLNQVADYYEGEVDYDLKRLLDLMQPLILMVLGALVLLLALGLFLPMWNMANLIK